MIKHWRKAAGALIGAGMFLTAATAAWAQGGPRVEGWAPNTLLTAVISTVVFGLLGIVLAILGYKVFDLLTPFDLEREMCEKQNMAVAVLCGAMVLGICLIVAAAVL